MLRWSTHLSADFRLTASSGLAANLGSWQEWVYWALLLNVSGIYSVQAVSCINNWTSCRQESSSLLTRSCVWLKFQFLYNYEDCSHYTSLHGYYGDTHARFPCSRGLHQVRCQANRGEVRQLAVLSRLYASDKSLGSSHALVNNENIHLMDIQCFSMQRSTSPFSLPQLERLVYGYEAIFFDPSSRICHRVKSPAGTQMTALTLEGFGVLGFVFFRSIMLPDFELWVREATRSETLNDNIFRDSELLIMLSAPWVPN
jgi:hypothetical protein